MATKRCSSCGQTYTDDAINFCLNDGELLSYLADDAPQTILSNDRPTMFAEDSEPTVFLNKPRVTNQTNWPGSEPIALWQGGQQNFPQQQFGNYPLNVTPNQTLAIVSLCLGLGSMTIGWCCSMGLLLSPAALITGFIALSMIKKDPQANQGRGLAIGGMVTGGIFLGLYLMIIVLYGIMSLLPWFG